MEFHPAKKKDVKRWEAESVYTLQGCFDCTIWDTFKDASADLDELADTVTSYTSFCENKCIPTKTVTIYQNSKPRMSKKIQCKLHEKNLVYKEYKEEMKVGSPSSQKEAKIKLNHAKYEVEKEIRQAKSQYRHKLEHQFSSGNSCAVWKGLQAITQYRPKSQYESDDPT